MIKPSLCKTGFELFSVDKHFVSDHLPEPDGLPPLAWAATVEA